MLHISMAGKNRVPWDGDKFHPHFVRHPRHSNWIIVHSAVLPIGNPYAGSLMNRSDDEEPSSTGGQMVEIVKEGL